MCTLHTYHVPVVIEDFSPEVLDMSLFCMDGVVAALVTTLDKLLLPIYWSPSYIDKNNGINTYVCKFNHFE